MSDLQCAVTVLVLPAGADVDVDAVRLERPVQVLAAAGVSTGLGGALDVPVRQVPDGGENRPVGHITRLLADLADEFRGECVVVVLPRAGFDRLSGQVLPAGAAVGGALVRVDADGHRWAPWPSAAPQ